MKISEIITDKYKLHIPPIVYYNLLADVVKAEEAQDPCEDCISRQAVINITLEKSNLTDKYHELSRVREEVKSLPSIQPKPKTDVLDKIRAEINDAKLPKNQMSFFRDGINCALRVIDKYKAGKE